MDLGIKIPLRSNLLILKGLRVEDFSEKISIYDAKSVPTQTVHTEIPSTFRTATEWSKIFSNRLCWMCGLPPTSYPKFIPENPRLEHDEDVCDVRTHFCEWTCVSRYVHREYPRERIADVMKTVCLFESKFSGRIREIIPQALPHTIMKPYCGDSGLTPAQYREKNMLLFRDNDLSTIKLEQIPRHSYVRKGRK